MAATTILGATHGRPVNSITVMYDDRFHELPSCILDGDASYNGSYAYPQVILAGTILGRNSSSGKYSPVKVTTVVESPATSATVNAFLVVNAAHFIVGDTISVGAQTGRVVTAINYSTNQITVNGSAFNPSAAEVVKTTNGFEKGVAILLETVEVRDPENRNNADKRVRAAISGFVISSSVRGDYAAASALSGNSLNTFLFSTNWGV